jgi:hypothetical protein
MWHPLRLEQEFDYCWALTLNAFSADVQTPVYFYLMKTFLMAPIHVFGLVVHRLYVGIYRSEAAA